MSKEGKSKGQKKLTKDDVLGDIDGKTIKNSTRSIFSSKSTETCLSSTPIEITLSGTQSSASQLSGITPLNKTISLEEEENDFQVAVKVKKPYALKKQPTMSSIQSYRGLPKRKDHSSYSLVTQEKKKHCCVGEVESEIEEEEQEQEQEHKIGEYDGESSLDYSYESLSESDIIEYKKKSKKEYKFFYK